MERYHKSGLGIISGLGKRYRYSTIDKHLRELEKLNVSSALSRELSKCYDEDEDKDKSKNDKDKKKKLEHKLRVGLLLKDPKGIIYPVKVINNVVAEFTRLCSKASFAITHWKITKKFLVKNKGGNEWL